MRPYLYEILLHMNPIILLLKFTSTELLYISTEQLLNCHGYIRKEQFEVYTSCNHNLQRELSNDENISLF